MDLVAGSLGITKCSVCRCLWQFCTALREYTNRFVVFPSGAAADAAKVAFRQKSGIYSYVICNMN